jgi:hypothetical protein
MLAFRGFQRDNMLLAMDRTSRIEPVRRIGTTVKVCHRVSEKTDFGGASSGADDLR